MIKKLYPLLFAATLMLLGTSCIDEVIKFVKVTDTIYVEGKPITNFVQTKVVDTVYRDLLRVDTVEVKVVVHDTVVVVNNVETVRTDTVVQIKTDSIFIERIVEKIVNHYDTVVTERIITNVDTVYIDKVVTVHDTIYVTEYEQRVIYQSVQFLFPGQSTWYVPDEFMTYYLDYDKAARDRNKLLPGGDLVVTRVNPDNLPGENWVSNFYIMAGDQAIIEISEQLPIEQARAALYRELTRWQLKKKYSNDVTRIMSPLFPVTKVITTNDLNILFQ